MLYWIQISSIYILISVWWSNINYRPLDFFLSKEWIDKKSFEVENRLKSQEKNPFCWWELNISDRFYRSIDCMLKELSIYSADICKIRNPRLKYFLLNVNLMMTVSSEKWKMSLLTCSPLPISSECSSYSIRYKVTHNQKSAISVSFVFFFVFFQVWISKSNK